MAKVADSNTRTRKTRTKRVTTIGKGKNSKPMKKSRNRKRGVSKYRGQGK